MSVGLFFFLLFFSLSCFFFFFTYLLYLLSFRRFVDSVKIVVFSLVFYITTFFSNFERFGSC